MPLALPLCILTSHLHGAALRRSLSLSNSAKPDAGRGDAKVLRLKEGSIMVPVTVIGTESQGQIQERE